VSTKKELWDYEKFVQLYNETADAHPGSWCFDRNGACTPEKLEAWYEGGSCTTLRELAEERFALEQQV
jgi:hypothetical protein